jgi:hypothetical protein
MDGQPAAVNDVRLIVELLEKLRVSIPIRKLKLESLSGITAKTAVFFSPRLHSSISSFCVILASEFRLNFSSREIREI